MTSNWSGFRRLRARALARGRVAPREAALAAEAAADREVVGQVVEGPVAADLERDNLHRQDHTLLALQRGCMAAHRVSV